LKREIFWFFAIFSGIIFDNMVERSVLRGTGLLKIGTRNVMEWSVKTKTSRRANTCLKCPELTIGLFLFSGMQSDFSHIFKQP
jgi:hypothetical protein